MSSNLANASAYADDLVDRTKQTTSIGTILTGLYKYRELLRNLVIKDLKLKYRGSVFGFLWSLVNPLLMIVVYAVAFTYILKIRSEGFIFSLMLGLLSWTFFSGSASMSTGAILDNAGLVKTVFFPRAILPISVVLFNFAQYLLTLMVFLPVMMIWYRVVPTPVMLLFPVFLLLQVIFTVGIALILSTATAFYRDVKHLLDVALSMLFWLTPIAYDIGIVPEAIRPVILLSPVSPFVIASQQLFFHGTSPESSVWLLATTYAVVAFAAGGKLIAASQDRFAEQL